MAVPIVDSANRSWPTNDVSDCGRVLRSGSARLVDITVQGHRLALKGQPSRCPSADARRFRARREGDRQPAFRLSSGSTYPPSTYCGLPVHNLNLLTVKRAAGCSIQMDSSRWVTVIVPSLKA